MILIHDTKDKSKPIQLTTEDYKVNVRIHENLPDRDDNFISYYHQNVVGINLQDGTMNIDDLSN